MAPVESSTDSALRPIERRILELSESGQTDAEIATRFRRTPGYVRRVRELAALPDRAAPAETEAELRPIERCVLSWREQGASYADIAARFRRTPGFIERVESYANYKLAADA